MNKKLLSTLLTIVMLCTLFAFPVSSMPLDDTEFFVVPVGHGQYNIASYLTRNSSESIQLLNLGNDLYQTLGENKTLLKVNDYSFLEVDLIEFNLTDSNVVNNVFNNYSIPDDIKSNILSDREKVLNGTANFPGDVAVALSSSENYYVGYGGYNYKDVIYIVYNAETQKKNISPSNLTPSSKIVDVAIGKVPILYDAYTLVSLFSSYLDSSFSSNDSIQAWSSGDMSSKNTYIDISGTYKLAAYSQRYSKT